MNDSDKKKLKIFGAALGGLMLLALLFGSNSPLRGGDVVSEETPKKKKFGIPKHQDAYYSAQTIIERRLQSPRSAKWPSHREVKIWDMDNGWVAIKGHVDADNAFGSSIRTPFTVTLSKTADGWRAQTLILDGETLIGR